MQTIPVILISDVLEKKDILLAMQMGIADYMIKPINVQTFNSKITSALKFGHKLQWEDASSRNQHILFSRTTARTIISFKSGWKDYLLAEAKNIFNAHFTKRVEKDIIVLDIHSLPELILDEVKILEKFNTFFKTQIHIVAGRHFGTIIANSNLGRRSKSIYIFWRS